MRTISHSKPTLAADDYEAVQRTLASGMIAHGEVSRQFERAVGDRLGVPAGLATVSGTAALAAALVAVGVSGGDEVVAPTYVCDAVAVAIKSIGAVPVLCDVGADRCVSLASVQSRITTRTTAVVVVHTFGAVADVAAIKTLGLPVIEDCCQAFGAARDGRQAGTLGDACVLSFHATKLMTTGEGGMTLSARADVSSRLALLRRDQPPTAFRITPMSDLDAALGVSQLHRYDTFLARRRELASFYFDALAGTAVELPDDVRDRTIFFRFPVRSTMPFGDVQRAFAAEGVQVRRGVDRLLHHDTGVHNAFPVAERLFADTVSLPIYPSLTDADAEHVARTAQRVFGKRS